MRTTIATISCISCEWAGPKLPAFFLVIVCLGHGAEIRLQHIVRNRTTVSLNVAMPTLFARKRHIGLYAGAS